MIMDRVGVAHLLLVHEAAPEPFHGAGVPARWGGGRRADAQCCLRQCSPSFRMSAKERRQLTPPEGAEACSWPGPGPWHSPRCFRLPKVSSSTCIAPACHHAERYKSKSWVQDTRISGRRIPDRPIYTYARSKLTNYRLRLLKYTYISEYHPVIHTFGRWRSPSLLAALHPMRLRRPARSNHKKKQVRELWGHLGGAA